MWCSSFHRLLCMEKSRAGASRSSQWDAGVSVSASRWSQRGNSAWSCRKLPTPCTVETIWHRLWSRIQERFQGCPWGRTCETDLSSGQHSVWSRWALRTGSSRPWTPHHEVYTKRGFQKTCSRCCQDELVVALCKEVLGRLSRKGMIKWDLQDAHCLHELSCLVWVSFPDNSPSHEFLDGQDHVVSVLCGGRITLNDTSEPIPHHQDLLDCFIASRSSWCPWSRTWWSPNLASLRLKAPLSVLWCFIFALMHELQWGLL